MGCLVIMMAGNPRLVDAQVKRALLIGINTYRPDDKMALEKGSRWQNLSGTLNDVDAMKSILINLYDFKEENISILKESKASRSGILTGLEDLTQKSQPGDIAFFYYSGHGSEVKNSLSTRQEGFFDEAIVPADAINGAKYIRDKELGVIFNKILDKGALLTVVFDCCHSGSLSRGIPSIDPPVTKSLPMDTADVKDPSVIPSPASRGALVIAASLPTQSANQLKSGELSLFTDAFIRSLREAGPNAPISDVVSRAAAIIKYQGEKPQIPNIDTDCPSSRTKAGLLGEPAGIPR